MSEQPTPAGPRLDHQPDHDHTTTTTNHDRPPPGLDASRDLAHEQALVERHIRRTRAERRRGRVTLNLTRLLVLAATLVVWELLSGPVLDPFFFSSPSDVTAALTEQIAQGNLLWHLEVTVVEAVSGYVLGLVAAVGCAVAVASARRLYEVVEPFVMAVYGIPRIALAPLFIIWFGVGLSSKILIAAFMVFFLVFMNTIAGFQAVNPNLIAISRLMGAGRAKLLWKVLLPSAAPHIMTGLRVSVPQAMIGAVVGEFISSQRGIGFFISRASFQLDIASAFAAIALLMVVILLMNGAVGAADRRLMSWRQSSAI